MNFQVKLNWDSNFSPALVDEHYQIETGLKVATSTDFSKETGSPYLASKVCEDLWKAPQINWDGRILGCCVNRWLPFGNLEGRSIQSALDSSAIASARRMLRGQAPASSETPCSTCQYYLTMKTSGRWLKPSLRTWFLSLPLRPLHRTKIRLENYLRRPLFSWPSH